MRRLWTLWKDSGDASLALDSFLVLVVPDVSASLAERNRWLKLGIDYVVKINQIKIKMS